jgi:hypothetical protein
MHTDVAMARGRRVPHWAASLEVRPIRSEEREVWRTLMATHHSLGFRGLVGESLYYVACVEEEWVALLGGQLPPGCATHGTNGLAGLALSNGHVCGLS